MQALRIGEAAAKGNTEAIEVQAAYEEADGNPLSPEVEAAVGVKIGKIFAPPQQEEPEKTAIIKPNPFPNPLAPK